MKEQTHSERILEHYGIKGMQWGVRRSQKQLAKNRERALKTARKRRKELSTEKGRAKDAARTKKWQEKYDLSEKEAQRRQRASLTANRRIKKEVLKTSAKVGAFALVANPKTGLKVARGLLYTTNTLAYFGRTAASKVGGGARLLFQKDMIVYAPGKGPAIGTFETAARSVMKQLPR